MKIFLELATAEDAPVLHIMQKAAFQPLLDKYQDFETSPANESIERLLLRIEHPSGRFYKIIADGELAGGIRVHWRDNRQYWIGPLFVDPSYQGFGIAQEVMKRVEEIFAQAATWELATILEERGNCHLYEKLGYEQTGKTEKLNGKTTLGFFKKEGAARE